MSKQGALKTIGLVAGIVATSALTILAQPGVREEGGSDAVATADFLVSPER